jgi:hypothetical protein
VAIGSAGSMAANQLLAKLLYGVRPTDPLTLAAGATVMASVSLTANSLPSIRAAGWTR